MSFIQSVKNFATNILNTAPNNKSVNNSQNNNSIFPSSKENNVNDFSKADSEDVEQYIQDAQNEYEVNNYSVCSTASSVVTSNYPSRGFETVTVTSPDGSKTETVRDSATKQIKGTTNYYPNGKIHSSFLYQENGKLQKEQYFREDGTKEKDIEYNSNGQVSVERNYNQAGKIQSSIKYNYDERGNQTELTAISYNSQGKPINSVSREYDENGKLKQTTTGEYRYSADGTILEAETKVTDANNKLKTDIRCTYDDSGKLILKVTEQHYDDGTVHRTVDDIKQNKVTEENYRPG